MGKITVKNLGKAYRQYSSRFGRLLEWISPVPISRHHRKWVLRDISFEVQPGEAMGIIGMNGAGKSTLLKMIAGTTQPTTGSIQMAGHVAALLELGMGFHPDFTGRQNIYMAGQILGLSTDEISSKMSEIETFAEIGEAIDQPVRTYSSGMQVRLAFSIATVKRPDILIVDEALSVGDVHFQHKSFNRIKDFQRQGTTLLLVSHDKAAIQGICSRAILLNGGRVELEGKPEEVMDYYNAMLAAPKGVEVRQERRDDGLVQTISGSNEATVAEICLLNEAGESVEFVDVGSRVTLKIRAKIHAPIERLVLGYMIKDRLGQPMFGTNTHYKALPLANVQPGEEVTYLLKFPLLLGPGSYSIATALTSSDTHVADNYEWRDLALVFNVVNVSREQFVGSVWLDPDIEIQRV